MARNFAASMFRIPAGILVYFVSHADRHVYDGVPAVYRLSPSHEMKAAQSRLSTVFVAARSAPLPRR